MKVKGLKLGLSGLIKAKLTEEAAGILISTLTHATLGCIESLPDRYKGGDGIVICLSAMNLRVLVVEVGKKRVTLKIYKRGITVKKKDFPIYLALFKWLGEIANRVVKPEEEVYEEVMGRILNDYLVREDVSSGLTESVLALHDLKEFLPLHLTQIHVQQVYI